MSGDKTMKKEKAEFQNVALLKEDHVLLKELADFEQRSMARELGFLIRMAYDQIVLGRPG
jgi:hypothetical protein